MKLSNKVKGGLLAVAKMWLMLLIITIIIVGILSIPGIAYALFFAFAITFVLVISYIAYTIGSEGD